MCKLKDLVVEKEVQGYFDGFGGDKERAYMSALSADTRSKVEDKVVKHMNEHD